MPSDIPAWLEAFGVVASFGLSAYALWKSSEQEKKRLASETSSNEKRLALEASLNEKRQALETLLHEKTNSLTERLNTEESTEERRRFFTTLWDKMREVQEIDVKEPSAAVIRKDLNTMELVALCWQANIVDRRMVYLSFAKMYHLVYEQIKSIQTDVPFLDKTGPELLGDSPAIAVLHRELAKMLEDEGLM